MRSADASGKSTKWPLRLGKVEFEVPHHEGVKYQAPDALSRLRTEESDESSLAEELPVVMSSETEKQEVVQMEYVDYNQPHNKRANNQGDKNGDETKPPTLRGISKAQVNDLTCTQAVLTIGLPKSISSSIPKALWSDSRHYMARRNDTS